MSAGSQLADGRAARLRCAACSSHSADAPPPTIAPARRGRLPARDGRSRGTVRPLGRARPGRARSTRRTGIAGRARQRPGRTHSVDHRCSPRTAPARTLPLPAAAHGAGRRRRRHGLRVDAAAATSVSTSPPARVDRIDVDERRTTRFTAIARRADGKLVLGSADGAVYTLGSDTAVGARLQIFARVDALVTQGNTVVVLDRGQTSVTTVDAVGHARPSTPLRAGEGATTMAADPAGRVLVADTRGEAAAGVRRRPADAAPALPGAGTRRTASPGRRGWPGCRRPRRIRSLVTIWPPEYPSRRCVIQPCSNRTPWPSTMRRHPVRGVGCRSRACR